MRCCGQNRRVKQFAVGLAPRPHQPGYFTSTTRSQLPSPFLPSPADGVKPLRNLAHATVPAPPPRKLEPMAQACSTCSSKSRVEQSAEGPGSLHTTPRNHKLTNPTYQQGPPFASGQQGRRRDSREYFAGAVCRAGKMTPTDIPMRFFLVTAADVVRGALRVLTSINDVHQGGTACEKTEAISTPRGKSLLDYYTPFPILSCRLGKVSVAHRVRYTWPVPKPVDPQARSPRPRARRQNRRRDRWSARRRRPQPSRRPRRRGKHNPLGLCVLLPRHHQPQELADIASLLGDAFIHQDVAAVHPG